MTKIICLVCFIIALLLIGAPIVSADSSMASLMDSQTRTCEETTTPPTCCIYADCPIAHIVPINLAQRSGRIYSSNNKIYPVSQPASTVIQAPFLNNIKPSEIGPNQNSPPISGVNYRCRNCLTQEEPPLS